MRECQICQQCYPDAVIVCPQDNQPTFQSIEGNPILEGKYRLEKRLGTGGMGVVYSGYNINLKTIKLAIKTIKPSLIESAPDLANRFLKEARAAAAIRHPNVIEVKDYGLINQKIPFMVMPLLEGITFQDLIANEKRLSPLKAIEWLIKICEGVEAIHSKGIVHRDLKPLNIMIVNKEVIILDLGVAKINSLEILGSLAQTEFNPNERKGTLVYMAPENFENIEVDYRADVFSLAVMGYQMLAGQLPFTGSWDGAIIKKITMDSPLRFADIGVQVPPAVEEAVFRALEKDLSKRTQSVKEFAQELKRCLHLNHTSPESVQKAATVSSINIITQPGETTVLLDGVDKGTTAVDGYLLVPCVAVGNHQITIRKGGYQTWEKTVSLNSSREDILIALIEEDKSIEEEELVDLFPADEAEQDPVHPGSTDKDSQPETSMPQFENFSGAEDESRNIEQSESLAVRPAEEAREKRSLRKTSWRIVLSLLSALFLATVMLGVWVRQNKSLTVSAPTPAPSLEPAKPANSPQEKVAGVKGGITGVFEVGTASASEEASTLPKPKPILPKPKPTPKAASQDSLINPCQLELQCDS